MEDTNNNAKSKKLTEKKILIIGLDGATFDLIEPWINSDELPNFAKILNEGTSANLISTIPPFSAQAWVSFMTGKNPGKHGVFDFAKKMKKSYDRRLTTAKSITGKTLWDILSDWNKKVGAINIPLTYPPKKVNGFMVSGLGTPGLNSNYTYPSDLKDILLSAIGDYVLDIKDISAYGGSKKKLLDDIYYITERGKEATLYLMRTNSWDIFMTVFIGTDRIQHLFWNCMDKKHPAYNAVEAEDYNDSIVQYYKKIDNILGTILENVDEDTTLIIMSDHGFGPLYKNVYMNLWLKNLDLLKLKSNFELLYKINAFLKNNSLYSKLKHILKSTITKTSIKSNIFSWLKHRNFFNSWIDWRKTKAYSGSPCEQAIYINLKGREPNGAVEPKEYEDVRNYIIKNLSELADPETGEEIVDRIYKKEELYSGPFLKDAPDIIFLLNDSGYYTSDGLDSEGVFECAGKYDWLTGVHRMNGILIIKGNNIRKGIRIKDARIIDLAPTILYLMDVPIPNDMDGRMLKEIFVEGSELAEREVVYQEVDLERESVKDRIRKLKESGKL